jgi:hypothetical protein
MVMDHDRAVCGIATCFDVRSKNGSEWSAADFDTFLTDGLAVPLLYDHGLADGWGLTPPLGVARLFEPVSYPIPGLLVLAEVQWADGFGDAILRDIRSVLSQTWLPAAWSFSIGARICEDGQLWLEEVSLTRKPAFADARILACGPDAQSTFEFCVEMSAAAARAA